MPQPTPAPGDENDLQLLRDSQQGDPRALDALITRHLPALQAFVRLRCAADVESWESVSDVVQSVCREVLQNANDFEYQGEARFRHFLYVSVLNKVRQKRRYHLAEKRDVRREQRLSRSADGDSMLLDCYATFCTPSQQAEARERVRQVEAAFSQLPEHYQEVICQARIIGLSQAEIAETMGKTVDSVRNLLARALVQLAAKLDTPDRE